MDSIDWWYLTLAEGIAASRGVPVSPVVGLGASRCLRISLWTVSAIAVR